MDSIQTATKAGFAGYNAVVNGAVPLLNWVGFGAAGVVRSSLAAGIQSTMYGGQTSGLFSLAQSVAAGGTAVAPIAAAVGIGVAGAVVVGNVAIEAIKKKKNNKQNKEEEKDDDEEDKDEDGNMRQRCNYSFFIILF